MAELNTRNSWHQTIERVDGQECPTPSIEQLKDEIGDESTLEIVKDLTRQKA